jgi:hypothetical protein
VVLVGCLATASCSVPVASQVRYVGNLPGCTTGPSAQATLVRAADRFSFAPSDGALVVSGNVAPNGSFAGSLVTNPARVDRDGRSGTRAFTLTVTGGIEGETASGIYETSSCRTAFRLSRVNHVLLP